MYMNDFTPMQTYHGFTLLNTEEVADIHSTAYLFEHQQSGARLLYLKNMDHNKVFSVAFKTPPADDCGTPHILEHSVLCGSRKYESKDPFNELAKGSLNTFLNAMTYADKTMYPVASCNEKDFHNLMDVYMDAVFFPKIYEKKAIFQQEGWRYVLKDEDKALDVTGVVYNEMKGALSDPESQLNFVISRAMFGETTYGFESGGHPDAIPDLTYEGFLDFHRKYYHPSNSYFYLYGDMDAVACLKHIHEGFLQEFQRSDALPVITETDCVKKGERITETYPASSEEEAGGTYLTYNLKAGYCTDSERVMALQILSYILLETNGSPLKTALLEAGICEETEGWFDSSTYEMTFNIVAKNADAEKTEDFIRCIDEECKRLVKEGLPADLVNGAIRKYEFLLKEEDYGSTPKGLIYCSRLMKRWLHGEEPLAGLRQLQLIEKLKQESKNGYFEKLLETVFVQNAEKVYVVFSPEKGKHTKEVEAWEQELKVRRERMTEADLAEIRQDAEKLDLFQKTAESEEVQAQIPLLEISEVEEMPQLQEVQMETLKQGAPVLYVPLESNGIVYMRLLFDCQRVPQECLMYTGLLTEILKKLDTTQYSFAELPTALNQTFGSLSFHNTSYNKNAEEYRSFLAVKAKVLLEDLEKAFSVLQEILFHTDFDALENLKKIVKSTKIKGESMLLNQPHYFGIFYGGSNIFPGLQIEDLTSGIRYYHFLCEVDAMLETDAASVIEKLKAVAGYIFCKENLEISLGCEKADFGKAKEQLEVFAENLPEAKTELLAYDFALTPEKAAFTSAGNVVYNITALDFLKEDIRYHGSFQVLQTIINLEYLWNLVRVQGGAYGCSCNFQRNGFAYFFSYRDPNVKATYDIYESLWESIAAFGTSERELTKYILGTINRLDQPKTNMDQLDAATQRYYRGITDAFLIQERREILKTTISDIQNGQKLLNCVRNQNICSIGDEEKLKKESEMFDFVKPLI